MELKVCRNIFLICSVFYEGNEDSNFVDYKIGCMYYSGLSVLDFFFFDF